MKIYNQRLINSSRQTRLLADISIFIASVMIFGWLQMWKWMRLFPLVEYRPKVFGDLPLSWLIQGWTLRGATSISTSFYFDTWVGRACTTNITCLNALPQLIHLLTAVTLFSIGKKVFGSRYIASIVLLLWLISVPFLETMAWQALDLDKIAALSTTLGAAMGIYFYRKPYSMQNILL